MNELETFDCATARTRLSACCDGEAERTPELAAHVDACSACRAFEVGCGAISRAFDALCGESPPAELAARRPLRVVRGGAWGMRVAAGLVGLVAIGGPGAWLEARYGAPAAPAETGWLEPLTGRAMHPVDAGLKTWSDAMAIVMSEERR